MLCLLRVLCFKANKKLNWISNTKFNRHYDFIMANHMWPVLKKYPRQKELYGLRSMWTMEPYWLSTSWRKFAQAKRRGSIIRWISQVTNQVSSRVSLDVIMSDPRGTPETVDNIQKFTVHPEGTPRGKVNMVTYYLHITYILLTYYLHIYFSEYDKVECVFTSSDVIEVWMVMCFLNPVFCSEGCSFVMVCIGWQM